MKPVTSCVVTGLGLAMAANANATIIASDSFTSGDPDSGYYGTGTLMNKNPTVGVSGFDGPWSTSWNQTGDLQSKNVSLSHAMIPGSTADGAIYTTTGPTARQIFRKIDWEESGVSPTDESAYWFSFAMSTSDGQRVGALGLRGTNPWPSGSGGVMDSNPGPNSGMTVDNPDLIGISVGFDNSSIAVWVDGIKTAIPDSQATAGETYFVLASIANDPSGLDQVTVNVYGHNQTLADLDDPFATVSFEAELTGKLRNLSAQKLAAAGTETEMYFDEFRFGTTMYDVVVPEPAALTMLGVGGLLVLGRRRRR